MGIAFVKQFTGSETGLPLIGPGFSFSQDILGAVGEAAIGAHNTAQWSPDLDNAANKAFVETFEAEYGRLPSVYASQGYDTAQLILSANAKAAVGDHEAFHDALKAADFPSVRGSSRSGTTSTRSRPSTPARSTSATTASSPTASSAPPSRTTSTPTRPSARCSDPPAGPPGGPAFPTVQRQRPVAGRTRGARLMKMNPSEISGMPGIARVLRLVSRLGPLGGGRS